MTFSESGGKRKQNINSAPMSQESMAVRPCESLPLFCKLGQAPCLSASPFSCPQTGIFISSKQGLVRISGAVLVKGF